MKLELNVVHLPTASLGLYKLASWRLESYFFNNIRFLALPKNYVRCPDESSKPTATTTTC